MRALAVCSVIGLLTVAQMAFGQDQPNPPQRQGPNQQQPGRSPQQGQQGRFQRPGGQQGGAGAGGAGGGFVGPPPGFAEDAESKKDLEFAKADGKPLLLDLYLPKKAKGPFPVIVWIHGGAWSKGGRGGSMALPLVKDGYAVASIEYRLVPVPYPAMMYDCKASVRWLRANAKTYNLDPDHIGTWGASAGGHLASVLGTSNGVKELEGDVGNLDQSSKVQCVGDFFGNSDFIATNIQRGMSEDARKKLENDPNSIFVKLLGGPGPDFYDRAKKASPLTYVNKDNPPFLIMHADKDTTVPFQQSIDLNDALKKAGVETELVIIKGAGHGTAEFRTPETTEKVRKFFDKYLKPGK